MSLESTKIAVTETPKPAIQAKQDLVNSIWNEARDFGEGVFHGAVEAPVNGVVQLTNHIANTHLPELQITNPKDDNTIAGKIGSLVGTTADMIGVTVATGGIGGAGAVATGLRLAAIGAVYSGVLTPSADNTKNFFADRATSAAVGALTFGAMGAAATGLDALGTFAAPAARSIMGSIGYGALTGVAGGAVNSEATATLKEGKALPNASEFFGDVASYAAFGGALGAASYGIQHLGNPLQQINTDNKKLTFYNDKDGNPIRIEGRTPVTDDPSEHVKWSAIKSADGSWTTKAQPKPGVDVAPPDIDSVVKNPDGSIDMLGSNESRHVGTDGSYTFRDTYQERADAKAAADAAEKARTADVEVNDSAIEGSKIYDYTGRLKFIDDNTRGARAHVTVEYNANSSDIDSIHLKNDDGIVTFRRSPAGTYQANIGDSVYDLDGTIKTVASQEGGKPDTLEFVGKNGRTFNLKPGNTKGFVQAAKDNMQLLPGKGGAPVVKVDGAGNMQISRNSNFRIPVINGKELGSGETATLTPDDGVAIKANISLDYPIWKTKPLRWGQAQDGTPQLQGTDLKPGSTVDVQGAPERTNWNAFSYY